MIPETPYGEGLNHGFNGLPYSNRFSYINDTTSWCQYYDGYHHGYSQLKEEREHASKNSCEKEVSNG